MVHPLEEKDIDMGTNKTPEYIRGFILPMDLGVSNIWESQSSFTQQNPTAGDPYPLQSSKMRLLSKGAQSTNGNITIVSRKAGSAGYGSRFTFKDNLVSNTTEYGRDAYNAISGFQYRDISTVISNNYYVQDSLVTSGNTLLIAIFQDYTNDIVFVRRIPQTGASTTHTVYTFPSFASRTQQITTTMCELEDGSILLGHLLEDDGKANIRLYRSTDDGVTWSTVSRQGWELSLSVGTSSGAGTTTYEIIRMRMVSISGSIVLLVETEYNNTSVTTRNQLFQYVSIDGGGTFTLLSTSTNLGSNSFRMINLGKRLGRYVFSYIGDTTHVHYMELPNPFSNIHLLRESSAFVSVTALNASTGTDDYMTGGDLATLINDDGSIYLYMYSGGSNDFINCKYSSDGTTFRYTNGNYTVAQGVVLNCDDSLTRLSNIMAVHWLGRGVIVSNMNSSTTMDNSVLMTYLGGYATVNLPQNDYAGDEADWGRVGFIRNYLPLDVPSDISGLGVVGSGTDSITGGKLRITSTGAGSQERVYTWNNLPTSLTDTDYVTQGLIIRCSLIVVSGGDISTSQRGFTLEIDNGTIRYRAGVYITPTGIVVDDDFGGIRLATKTHDNTQGVDILFSIANNKVSGWYRTLDYDETREWTVLIDGGTVTSSASSSAGQIVKFGHLTYASAYTTDWNEFHVSNLTATGRQLATGFVNPDDCASMPYPPLGQFAYVYDNVSISSTDGSTYEGEQFDIIPQYEYPIGNTFQSTSPSPRIQWRSTAVASGAVAAQTISWKLYNDIGSTLVEHMPNDLVGFHFANVNWRSGELFYHNGTSWVSLATIQNEIRCGCLVKGRTIRGDATLTQPYFTLNELVGWTAYFSVGETNVAHKIVSNTEGKFGGTATGTKQATITFETPPPSSATTVYLIPNNFSMVINFNGIQASGFKLEIASQVTYHNDIRIGEVLIGPVIVPGRQYGRGRTISMESGTETIETQDGMRYSRELRPPQRLFSLAWTDGIDISQLQGGTPDIDYWISSTSANAEPIAVNNEAPDLMLGFLDYVQGQLKHFVYLPNITKSTSSFEDKRYLGRVDEQVLVTLESNVQIEHVVGDELQTQTGEVFRIATINMKQVT